MAVSSGAKALKKFRAANGLTLRDVAAAIGTSAPSVFDWERGTTRPRPQYRAALAKYTGGAVAVEAWDHERERAAVAAVSPLLAIANKRHDAPAVPRKRRARSAPATADPLPPARARRLP